MGWIETLDSGRYRAVYRDGTGRRHSQTFSRKGEAKAWLAADVVATAATTAEQSSARTAPGRSLGI